MYPSTPRPPEPTTYRAFDAPPPALTWERAHRALMLFLAALLLVSLAVSMAAFHTLEARTIERRNNKDCPAPSVDQCVAIPASCYPSIP